MLLSTTAIVKWHNRNKRHYIELGYKFTKLGDEFEVKVEHLSKNSHAIVEWECDGCHDIITGTYQTYMTYVKDDGKIYCTKCKKDGKFKSFEDLCIELDRQDLLDRWDYDKNGCKPSEVSYSSGIPRWFKCDKHPDTHHSELKSVANFTSGSNGVMDCKQCNSIMQYAIDNNKVHRLNIEKNKEEGLDLWNLSRKSHTKIWCLCDKKDYHNDNGGYLMSCCNFSNDCDCSYCTSKIIHPKDSLGQSIVDMYDEEYLWKIWNKELNGDLDPFTIAPCNDKKVWWNCPDGKHEPYLRNPHFSKQCNYRCPDCVIYTGEKEIENILLKYNIEYNMQYSYNDCKCTNPLPFDFYLPYYNILIEYDGEQHFRPVNFGGVGYSKSLDNFITTKIHDTMKNIYCQDNNIKLIRIPYYDFDNIEEILIRELNLNK